MHFCWNKNIFVARLLNRADAGVGEPGRTVNPLADAFGGSNPSPPTKKIDDYDFSLREYQKKEILVPLFFCAFFNLSVENLVLKIDVNYAGLTQSRPKADSPKTKARVIPIQTAIAVDSPISSIKY